MSPMLVLWLLGYYFILFFSKNHPAGAEVNVGKRPCFVLKTQVVDATPGWLDRQRPRRSARSPVGGNISLGLAGEPRAAGAPTRSAQTRAHTAHCGGRAGLRRPRCTFCSLAFIVSRSAARFPCS